MQAFYGDIMLVKRQRVVSSSRAMSDQWYVQSNGEQLGPYSGEQLVEYAQEGRIISETLVWAEGMTEWAPASEIPGLIPAAPEPVVAAPKASTAWAPPGSRLATRGGLATTQAASLQTTQASVDGEYPMISIKRASFGLWLGTFAGGIVLFILAIAIFFSAAAANIAAQNTAPESSELVGAGQIGMASILYFGSIILMLCSSIFFLMNLYRAWACLQPGGAQTTPGKAVGFMFIPFFNIYWVFVAINGLPKDWNRVVASYKDLQNAPRLSETTFLLYCIGIFFAPLLVMIFPMMSQLCKGINFFADRRKAVANSGYSVFGGR